MIMGDLGVPVLGYSCLTAAITAAVSFLQNSASILPTQPSRDEGPNPVAATGIETLLQLNHDDWSI
jgi:hypothetical protein